MGLSNRFPGQIVPMETESAVRDGDLVVVGSADNKCAFPGGASPTAEGWAVQFEEEAKRLLEEDE